MSMTNEEAIKILSGRIEYYAKEGYIGTVPFREALNLAVKALNENAVLHNKLEQANAENSRLQLELSRVNSVDIKEIHTRLQDTMRLFPYPLNNDKHLEDSSWDGSGD